MHKTLALTAFATLAGLAQAQIGIMPKEFGTAPTYAYPVSYFAINNGSSTSTWRTAAFRFQMIYDTSVFTGQGITGPTTFTRLRFRAADGIVNAGGQVYSLANVHLSSSPSSHAAPSTTFATNQGLDNTLVYSAPVTVAPCAGTAPNDYVIDLPLSAPFTYDPTLGLDLCVEVDAPTPSPTNVPSMATSATTGYVDGGSRISAAGQATATGALSAFASVIWFEFTGPGGVSSVAVADNQKYGNGCYSGADSFYEVTTRALMDLGGAPAAENVLYAAYLGAAGYAVTSAPSAWYAPTGTQLLSNATTPAALGDDGMSGPQTLPFAFPYNGGSTTVLHACSNGYATLAATTATTGDYTPTAAELLSQAARIAPFWADLHAGNNLTTNPASGVYFDVDPSGTVVYVTWLDIAELGGAAGATSINAQIALHQNGDVEFRYGTKIATGTSACIVGMSKGILGTTNSADPGSLDLSASLPFATTGPDQVALDLSVPAYGFLNEYRPVLGQTVNYVTNNLPASALLGSLMLNFGGIQSGVSLAGIGMPGCDLNVSPFFAFNMPFLGGTASVTTPVGIPTIPAFIGANVQFQSVALVPGVNAFGAITSNGLRSVIGNF